MSQKLISTMLSGKVVYSDRAPNHVVVKIFTRNAFLRANVRMLKLYHQSVRCFDISNVFFSIVSFMHHFLPLCWKPIFPITMPLSFTFPPMIASLLCFMRPVPNLPITTFSNHMSAATRTNGNCVWSCFYALFSFECVFHASRITRRRNMWSLKSKTLVA